MAIHPAFRDLPVSIKCGGIELLEYEDTNVEDIAPNHMIRYLEIPENPNTTPPSDDSEIGQEDEVATDTSSFEIHADVHSLTEASYAGHDGLAVYVQVDGEEVDSMLIFDQMIDVHFKNGKTCISRGQYRDGDTVLPYRFDRINKLDAAAAAIRGPRSELEKEKLQQLGIIRISVWYVSKHGVAAPVANEFRDRSIAGLNETDFKGKAITHSVGFGEATQDAGGATWSDTIPDFEAGEVAVWEFRCRSRDALKDELIIPRTPSPSLPEENEDEADLAELANKTHEELVAMAAAARKKEREANKIKIEVKTEKLQESGHASAPKRKRSNVILCIGDDDDDFHEEPLPQRLRREDAPTAVENIDDDEEGPSFVPGSPTNTLDHAEEDLEGSDPGEPVSENWFMDEVDRRYGGNVVALCSTYAENGSESAE